MNVATPTGSPFRRLLLALDSGGSPATVELSARLAALLGVPLEAFFVEDEELLGIAGLPVSREVSWLGLPAAEPGIRDLELAMRRRAARFRRLVEAALGGTAAHFEIVRAPTDAALRGALRPGDFLVMSRQFGPLAGRGGLGRAVSLALEAGWSALLLLDQARAMCPGPVTAWYDGSPAGEAAVALARRFADLQGRPLRVLAPSTLAVPAGAMQGALIQLLPSARDPLLELGRTASALLVLPATAHAPTGARWLEVLEKVRTPLLLLR